MDLSKAFAFQKQHLLHPQYIVENFSVPTKRELQ